MESLTPFLHWLLCPCLIIKSCYGGYCTILVNMNKISFILRLNYDFANLNIFQYFCRLWIGMNECIDNVIFYTCCILHVNIMSNELRMCVEAISSLHCDYYWSAILDCGSLLEVIWCTWELDLDPYHTHYSQTTDQT